MAEWWEQFEPAAAPKPNAAPTAPAAPAGNWWEQFEPAALKATEPASGLMPKPQPAPVSRGQTALSQFGRGAAEVGVALPQAAAIGQGQAANETLALLDQIDAEAPAGRRPTVPGEVAPLFQGVAGEYRVADPARRAAIRTDLAKTAAVTETPLYQASERARAAVNSYLPVDQQMSQEFWTGQVPQGLGSAVGFMATGVAGRAMGASATGAVMAPGSAMGAAAQFSEAIEAGASIEDAYRAANLGAAVGLSEAIPIGNLLERIDKGTGGSVRRLLTNVAKQGTEEAVQEAFQGIMDNAIAAGIYDPERGLWEGVASGTATGGVVGGIMGLLTGFGGRRMRSVDQPVQPEEIPLSPEDQASPLPDDLIREGRATIENAEDGRPNFNEPTTVQATTKNAATGAETSTTIKGPTGAANAALDEVVRIQQVSSEKIAAIDQPAAEQAEDDDEGPSLEALGEQITQTLRPGSREAAQAPKSAQPAPAPMEAAGGLSGAPTAPVPVRPSRATEAAQAPEATPQEVVESQAAVVEPNPSDAQKEAGVYRKGHVKIGGLDISIETPKGGERSGTDKDGKRWSVKMPAHYGYVKRTEGADGDHLDVYIGGNPEAGTVFVVDQVDADTGAWDEHKGMVGFNTEAEAIAAYDAAFNDGRGPERRSAITAMPIAEFEAWVREGDTSKPVKTARVEQTPVVTQDQPATLPTTIAEINAALAANPALGQDPAFIANMREVRAREQRQAPPEPVTSPAEPVTQPAPEAQQTQAAEPEPVTSAAAGVTSDVSSMTREQFVEAHRARIFQNKRTPGVVPIGREATSQTFYPLPGITRGGKLKPGDTLEAALGRLYDETPIFGSRAKQEAKKAQAATARAQNQETLGQLEGVDFNAGARVMFEGMPKDNRTSIERYREWMEEMAVAAAQRRYVSQFSLDNKNARAGFEAMIGVKLPKTLRDTREMIESGRLAEAVEAAKSPPTASAEDATPAAPPAWFADRTEEGRRQLAEAAGYKKGAQRSIAKMNWTALNRSPTRVAKLEAAAREADAAEQRPAGASASGAQSQGVSSGAQPDAAAQQPLAQGLAADAEALGDSAQSQAATVQAQGVVDVPSQRAPDASEQDAAPTKGRLDVGPTYAEFRANALQAHPTLVEGFGSLDVPSQRAVVRLMRRAIHNGEVLQSIVSRVPVEVMNNLVGRKLAPKRLLDDVSVLSDALSAADVSSDVLLAFMDAALTATAPGRAEVAETGVAGGFVGNAAAAAGQSGQKSSSNKIFTDDAAERARRILRSKLTQFNAGLDPETIQAGITLAGWHVERGARTFAAYAKAMIDDLGEDARPYLRSWYEGVRYYPGFDAQGMTPAAEIDAIIAETPAAETEQEVDDDTQPEAIATDDRAGDEGPGAGAAPGAEEAGAAGPGARGSRRGVRSGTRRSKADRAEPDLQQEAGGDARGSDGSRARPASRRSSTRGRSGVSDYRAPAGSLGREGSWAETAERNLEIVELVNRLREEGRPATTQEQALIAKFTGWGASEIRQNLFATARKDADGVMRLHPSTHYRKDQWKALVERAAPLLEGEVLENALQSTQYAHYTSESVVRSIWSGVERLGFSGGKILEPGMGSGLFAIAGPDQVMADSRYTGIEFDDMTAAVAQALLPNQNVLNADFVEQKLPDGFFDVAIGNPPFSQTKITQDPAYRRYRFSLHDYFFAKSVDKVRPGGLLVFVTSRYTMDKRDDKARRYLEERADLLGAIRLPQTAFKANAGTEVVTDVLFLRKRAPGDEPSGMGWRGLAEVQAGDEKSLVNEYFAANPDMVLGTHALTGSMYRENEYTVTPRETPIEDDFRKAIERLPENVYKAYSEAATKALEAKTLERDFNIGRNFEGSLYADENGNLRIVEQGAGVDVEEHKKLAPKQQQWLKDYLGLRDAVKVAHKDQLTDGDWKASLKALNKAYDAFTKKHGPVKRFTESERQVEKDDGTTETVVTRRYSNESLLRLDIEHPLIYALERITEDGRIIKAPFLLDRTLDKPKPPKIETPQDALMVSLDQRGKLDLNHIAELSKTSVSDVLKALGDGIYETPEGEYQLADEYLSGDVVAKAEAARVAAGSDPRFERNVKALEEARPRFLEPAEITVSAGVGWVPAEDVNEFADEVLGYSAGDIDYEIASGTWAVPGASSRSNRRASDEYGTDRRSSVELLDAVLNNRTIKIVDTVRIDGKTSYISNPQATQAAQEKAQKIEAAFKRWLWTDAKRVSRLTKLYNDRFNNIAPRKFDGSHLTTPGLSLKYDLHPHQKRAIWRVIQTGNTYLAHAVGAGKTLEMIVSAMEQRRLGLVRKPMFVVPNHMLQQFAGEFVDAYPTAKIMVADEHSFHTDARRRFMAQAAMNDLDAIIITHSSFGRVNSSMPSRKAVLDGMLEELDAAINETDSDQRIMRRKMEQQKEQITRRFLGNTREGDAGFTFEDMGVDFLYVDEAHEFRKLGLITSLDSKGIDTKESQRAIDLYIKSQFLERTRPGRSMVMASGTPVTNTMGELYNVMRYMDGAALERDGLQSFDAWARMFGEVVSSFEQNAAGVYESVARFAKFNNMPELMSRVRSFMDVLTSNQLRNLVKMPTLKTGEPQNMIADASPATRSYMQNVLLPRIQAAREWKPSREQPGNPDPIINIITDGRLSAIDERFFDNAAGDNPNSKLNRMIDEIIRVHKANAKREFMGDDGKPEAIKGAAQIVFSKVGFGEMVGETRGFDIRGHIARRLKRAGIPSSQVAWMNDYKSHSKKQTMFKEMRNGKKRILIGSPDNMGTGLNVQKRLAALHYLSPPWFPSDVEQPHGRIMRQGNQNDEVEIFWYATKGTYDSTAWSMVARKARFIEQAFSGEASVRTIDDISEASQYEMAAAMAAGDDRVIQLADLGGQIERLQLLRQSHEDTQRTLARNKDSGQRETARQQSRISLARSARKAIDDKFQQPGVVEIDGKTYEKQGEGTAAIAAAVLKEVKRWTPRANGQEEHLDIGTIGGMPIMGRMVASKWNDKLETSASVWMTAGPLDVDMISPASPENLEAMTDGSQYAPVQRALSAVRSGPENMIREAESRIEQLRAELGKIEKQLGAPFEREAELNEGIAERARLEEELKQDGVEAPADLVPPADADLEAWEGEGGSLSVGPQVRYALRLTDDAAAKLPAVEQSLRDRLKRLGIADRVALKLKERLVTFAEDGTAWEAEGWYWRRIITLSLNSADSEGYLNHEAIHALRDLGLFTKLEWAALERAAKADADLLARIREQYADLGFTEDQLIEEVVAEQYRAWASGQAKTGGFMRKAFEKVRGFFRALGQALRGQSFTTADAVFERVESGEVGARGPEAAPTADEMPRFALSHPGPAGGTPLDRAKATTGKHVGKPTPLKQRVAQWWETNTERAMARATQAAIDRFHSFQRLEGDVQAARGSDRYRFPADHHMGAYTSSHFAMNESAYMHTAMYEGPPVLNAVEGVVEADESTKSLMKLLEPLDTQEKIDAFEMYAWARRANELKKTGREPAPQSDIDAGLALAREFPEVVTVFRDWTRFNRKVLDFARDSGLITDQAHAAFSADAHYVPFYRAEVDSQGRRIDDRRMAGSGGTGIEGMRSGIKTLRGSERQVAGIVENMVRNTERLIARSYRNVAAQKAAALMIEANRALGEEVIAKAPMKWLRELVPLSMLKKNLEAVGMDVDAGSMTPAELRELTGVWGMVPPSFKSPTGEMLFSVMIGGKPHWFTTPDPMLYESLTSLAPKQMSMLGNAIFRIARAPADALRWGVTNEPTFAVANFLRDMLSTFVVYGTGPSHIARVMARFFKNSASGLVYGEAARDPAAVEIQSAGGGIGGWWSEGPTKVRREMQRRRKDVGMARRAGRGVIGAWERYQAILRASEQANRIEIYKELREHGTSKAEAAFQAMDVTNFQAKGASDMVRLLTELTPFLNARIQGLYRLYRGGRYETPGRVGPYGSTRAGFVINGMILTAASMAIYAANVDDEEYRDLEQWEKDLYYHIRLPEAVTEATGAKWFRIPRPFEVGAIFSTLPERAADQVLSAMGVEGKQDEGAAQAWDSFSRILWDTFSLQPTQLGKVVLEQWANWSSFLGRSIVPKWETDLPAPFQYGPSTSETARAIGMATGTSPRRLEYLTRELGGTMAAHALVAMDSVIANAQGKVNPAKRWYEQPVISRFVRGDSPYTKWAERYYKLQGETDAMVQVINRLEREGADPEFIDSLIPDDYDDRRKFFRGTRKDLRDIRDDMNDIYQDDTMSSEEKRQEIEALREVRAEIYREVRELER